MSELVSTRDLNAGSIDYPNAIIDGLAPDGGLFMAQEFPVIPDNEMLMMSRMSYTDLATVVQTRLIGTDIPGSVIYGICEDAYSERNFPEAQNDQTVPVQQVGNYNIHVQDLSGGPTAAFKDIAMQVVTRQMDYVLGTKDQTLGLAGATSGDTGSAAEAPIKGLDRLWIVMLSPLTGMSLFQKAQMGELSGGNVVNVSVDAPFTPCQTLVKELMADPEFQDIGAVNSINIGRIFAQVPYYFSGYFQTVEHLGDPIDVVVPTGNFGNILAGHIARRMGLPVRNLVVATNENNVLHELIETGIYRRKDDQKTSSPSMDITEASNYERLVYEIFGNNPGKTAEYMRLFKNLGLVSFQDFGISADILKQHGFGSGSSTHSDRINSMRWTHQEASIVIDPHTADAVTVARRMQRDIPVLCMSTAKPVKFEQTVLEALHFVPKRPQRFSGIEKRAEQNPDAFVKIPPELDALRAVVRGVREKQQAIA